MHGARFGAARILVNEVAPGYVNAGLSAQVGRSNARREQANARVPVQR
jgi:hypothetical protein